MLQTLISDRKIRVALVGCGRIAQNHLEAMKHHKDHLELIAVCDINEAALVPVTAAWGVPGFVALETMLDTVTPDLVVLCTPSGLHPKQAIMAAGRGCHVMTEKPMATRWEDGLLMLEACQKAGVHLFVVKQNRLNQTLVQLKRAIDQNRFGKIYLASVNVFWTRPQSYYDQGGWRGTYRMDGGAFMNQASHYIDLLQWLMGSARSVHAMMGTLGRKIEAEDTGVLNLRWAHGALGSVAVTMLTYPKNMEGSLTILGEKGTVRIGGVAVNQIMHWEFDEALPEDAHIRDAGYETASVYGFGHTAYYENIVAVLQQGAKPLVDGHEGLKSLELLIASYRSARDGVTVNLPLEL